jgi:hypothetical protein
LYLCARRWLLHPAPAVDPTEQQRHPAVVVRWRYGPCGQSARVSHRPDRRKVSQRNHHHQPPPPQPETKIDDHRSPSINLPVQPV